MLPFGELIGGAFRIALRNRHLWLFGVFVATPGLTVQAPIPTGDDSPSPERSPPPETIDPALGVAVLVGGLLLVGAYAALGALSHGALARSVAAIERGEQRRLRSTWRGGRASFWRILGLGVLAALIAFAGALALLLAVGIPAFGMVALVGGPAGLVVAAIALVIVFFAVMLPLFLALAMVVQHAVRELALRDAGVIEGLRGGWRLLRRSFGASVLLLLIQQGLSLAAGFVIAIVALVLAVPAILLLASGAAGATVVAIVTAAIVMPLALVAYGAVGAFSHGLWTLAYLWLDGRRTGPEAREGAVRGRLS